MKKDQTYPPFSVSIFIRPSRVGVAIGYPSECHGSLELLEVRKARQMLPVPFQLLIRRNMLVSKDRQRVRLSPCLSYGLREGRVDGFWSWVVHGKPPVHTSALRVERH